jgi:hypothetical protein
MEAPSSADVVNWVRAMGLTKLLSELPENKQQSWEDERGQSPLPDSVRRSKLASPGCEVEYAHSWSNPCELEHSLADRRSQHGLHGIILAPDFFRREESGSACHSNCHSMTPTLQTAMKPRSWSQQGVSRTEPLALTVFSG